MDFNLFFVLFSIIGLIKYKDRDDIIIIYIVKIDDERSLCLCNW